MTEYEIDYGTFIGGWYMSEDVCDSVIDVLNSEQHKLVDGELGVEDGGHYEEARVNTDFKKCKELFVYPNEFEKISPYIFNLAECLELYKKRYPWADKVGAYSLKSNAMKIQHYGPGDGFYKWHMENVGVGNNSYSHLSFMTYLNTLDNAGTEFFHQKITTPCEKGLTIIWPAGWTHTHRGVINYDSEKTIITGWFSFDVE